MSGVVVTTILNVSLAARLPRSVAETLTPSVPLPDEIARLIAVSDGPSTSVALAKSWACVISRAPLSSAIAAKLTGVLVGASLAP